MKVLLRSEGSGGAATERSLDVAALRLGRDAGQDVVLNDLRVALQHAEIAPRKALIGTAVHLKALGRLAVSRNGVPVRDADLAIGDALDFGRFRLTVQKPVAGHALVLLLSESAEAREERAAQRASLKTRLADTGLSMRRLSWLLLVAVLAGGLLLPLASHRSQGMGQDLTRDSTPRTALTPEIVWNSGPLSSAHQRLHADCGACHRKPFERVRDESCTGCHGDLAAHIPASNAEAHGMTGRCTSCHAEHNGPTGLVPRANGVCTDCHEDTQPSAKGALLPVADFSRAHPDFLLRVQRQSTDGFRWIEARQSTTEAAREDTGLKFPHALHLAAKGIDAPEGQRVMACADCHTPSGDALGFVPVTMETHCADCHRLDFDPAAKQRTLPHGDPRLAVQAVRDHFARVALGGGVADASAPAVVRQRRRPGETLPAAQAKAALAWADARAGQALKDVFERRTCLTCHQVGQSDDPASPWTIAPVAAQGAAFSGTPFPHPRHASEDCQGCHAAETSKHSEDVLLPTIARCRDCHGDTGAMTETPSPCQACHVYHPPPVVSAAAPP